MPSSVAHASVAVLLAPLFGRDMIDRRTMAAAGFAAAIPDLDAIGRPFGFGTYGYGVAFLAPFSMTRWKSAWQPLSGLLPEMILLCFPALLVYGVRRRELSLIKRANG